MAGAKNTRELPPFTRAEFEERALRARRIMARERLDGMMLTSRPNMEYLSGFTSQFPWNSQSRPWYFVFPRVGTPTAVIPTVGEDAWRSTSWVTTIHTWPSPTPENEGLDILKKVIGAIRRRHGRFGVELGPETRLGMPAGDLLRLARMIRPFELVDCEGVMRGLRLIKSPAEVARIRRACLAACDAFDELPRLIRAGDSEKVIMRKFKAACVARGVDETAYMMTRTGRDGLASWIYGPTARVPKRGDVLAIDTGCVYDGYFCDFNRNYAFGKPTEAVKRAHAALHRATEAGLRAAHPGATAEEVFLAQARVLAEGAGQDGFARMGRFGHGLGKLMTEPPSNKQGDKTRLRPGMVLTIEPGIILASGRMLAHEENILITEDGNRLLTRRAPREIPVIPI